MELEGREGVERTMGGKTDQNIVYKNFLNINKNEISKLTFIVAVLVYIPPNSI